MPRFASSHQLLRPREGHGTAPVAQIELFFDLVFVFAVTQLSSQLRSELSVIGLVHTAMLFLAVWWAWIYTAWVTNWLEPRLRPVQSMLVVLMFCGLALSTSLPAAFGRRGLAFAAAYVAIQLGRSLFMLWAVRGHDDGHFRNFQRVTVWAAASGLFWLLGGILPPGTRLWCWLAALALDLTGPSLGFLVPVLGRSVTKEWSIDSYHLAERCAGFILIALGESITVTGGAFSSLRWSAANGAAFLAAFLGAGALWWIYFDKAAERAADAFAESEDPGWVARSAYTYVHGLLVAGIIIVAAGDYFLLEMPMAPAGPAVGMMVIGGPAVFLLGNGVFRRVLHPRFPPSHRLGLGLLALLACGAPFLSVLEAAWGVTAALVGVIIYSDILLARQAG